MSQTWDKQCQSLVSTGIRGRGNGPGTALQREDVHQPEKHAVTRLNEETQLNTAQTAAQMSPQVSTSMVRVCGPQVGSIYTRAN